MSLVISILIILLPILVILHFLIIARYCIGNIIRPGNITTAEYSRWLLIIVLIPFYGYYKYLTNKIAEERSVNE
jgi:membrane-bound acyltransferase YfiQ involved in biofilm formation